MLPAASAAPAIVYLLADNLDAALAAGEDLLKSTITWHTGDCRVADDLASARTEEREALEAMRSLELILIARVLKSRESAGELAKIEIETKSVAKLYIAGTALLTQTVGDLGDGVGHDFDAGDCITAYLRARGLIAEDAAAPVEAEAIAITEEFRVGGRVPLGALMDLVAMFLDTLETHYNLYDADESTARAQRATGTPAAQVLV